MKKFTRTITKAVLTMAAVISFNAAVFAADYETQTFDPSNWSGSYTNEASIDTDKTIFELFDLDGIFTNAGELYNSDGYSIFSHSTTKPFVIENYGHLGNINSNTASGIKLAGYGGQLNNFGVISSGYMGVEIDSEPGHSNYEGFYINNHSIINGSVVGILQHESSSDADKSKDVFLYNSDTAYISGTNTAVSLEGYAEIINDGLIQARTNTAVRLIKGGIITNNGIIRTEAGFKNAVESYGHEGNSLILKGTGTYEGNILYAGSSEDAYLNGILLIDNSGMNLKNSRIMNWHSVGINGGNHYMNFQNDGQALNPKTSVYLGNNTYLHAGYGGPNWGDANFHLSGNSLLNPYKNLYSTFWDEPALESENYPHVIYDRKEFEKLTVNNLSIAAGSGLVIDIKNSEPDYEPRDTATNPGHDEDDRTGFWISYEYEKVQSDYNPDGTYGGFGYSTRLLKTQQDDFFDLYLYQRVNFDKIHVMGTASIEKGAKLYLLDRTDWLQDDGTRPTHNEFEGPVDEIQVDIFDGNINFSDFNDGYDPVTGELKTNIDFYSDYYGIDRYDDNSGVLYLSTFAYTSGQKGQIDWWLKEASLGFPDSNPAAEQAVVEQAVVEQVAVAPLLSGVEVSQSGSFDSTVPAGAEGTGGSSKYFDPSGILVRQNPVPNTDQQTGPPKAPYIQYYEPTPEKLPYQIAKHYSAKITDLDKSIELKNVIYGFQKWKDVDAFMDSLNKLEYASLATSNLNLISNRVAAMYNRLGADYDLRDGNNVSIWGDVYFSNDSLDGEGNHGITGQGTEFVIGFDKLFNEKFTLGLSFNNTTYESIVNDSGLNDKIDSEGYGLNVYAMLEHGALSHKMMLGYASYDNTGDYASFDSNEMFAAYRAEYTIERPGFDATWIAGLRYSKVNFAEMREDANNGLKAFDQDSLETELGLELSKQFKRLGVSVSGVWMHELLDSQTTAQAFTSFGDFEQKGIARDEDSFRATIGLEYQLSDKVTLDFDYAKEMSANSDSDSVNGKITFRF